MENRESKEILLSIFGIALLILAVAGISYAIFLFSKEGRTVNSILTGSIEMSFIESETNVIHIHNAMPVSDVVGMVQNDYFDFSIEANLAGNSTVFYEINAKEEEVENKIDSSKIKFYLEKKTTSSYQEVLKPTNFIINQKNSSINNSMNIPSMLLYQGKLTNNLSGKRKIYEKYRLRVWIDEKSPIELTTKNFKFRINVNANM